MGRYFSSKLPLCIIPISRWICYVYTCINTPYMYICIHLLHLYYNIFIIANTLMKSIIQISMIFGYVIVVMYNDNNYCKSLLYLQNIMRVNSS